MKTKAIFWLKLSFLIGTIADALVALNWYFIAFGINIPNYLNGYTGSGADYQLAMYIAALFMTGWTIILAWGYRNPLERRDLLIITALLLLFSVITELLIFPNLLNGNGFTTAILLRLALVTKFSFSYFYSRKI